MAIGQGTFSSISGAVNDLFQGRAAKREADIRASGLRTSAESTEISAEGTRLNAAGLRIKAAGDIAEAQQYDLASALARKNAAYTRESTGIQQMQLQRQITGTIGGQVADVAGAGLKQSGSAIYLLADSARQGELAKTVLAKQGEITEAGYEEQAQSFDVMSAAARMAAAGETDIAGRTDVMATRISGLAQRQRDIAVQTEKAGQEAKDESEISATIKGISAVASVFF
jgi:hypothetical protein